MHRLFETPELVSLICARLDASYHPWHLCMEDDYVPESTSPRFKKTALVSKQFYLGIIPHVWASVDLSDLFKRGLIPALVVQNGEMTRAYISDSISYKRMSRFRFYAPYIKTLRVHKVRLEVHGLNFLVSSSQATKLLPNLVELVCSIHDLEIFTTFLSRSTRRVTLYGPHCSLFSIGLLEIMARTCPGVRMLDFHPDFHEPANTVFAQNRLRSFTLFSSFQYLRVLITVPMILQSPVLELIAQLPRLKRLTIQPNHAGAQWDPQCCQQLPPGSFPALEELKLCLKSSYDAKRFWELIPLLNLKTLDLAVGSVVGDNELRFISTLCQTSPQITSLELGFPSSGEVREISADMFEYLARLPLTQNFSLDRAVLDFEDVWIRVASAWPHLKLICCLDQPTDLGDLLLLSSNLPELGYIECDFDLEDAADTVMYNWKPDGQPPFYPRLMALVIKQFELRKLTYGAGLSDVARYIAYFWPKVEVRSTQEELIDEDPDEDDSEAEAQLNKQGMWNLFRQLIRASVRHFHDG